MKRFFKFAGTFLRSIPQIILFELMFKLILTAIGAPLIALLIKLAMNHADIRYLTGENMLSFLLSPVTIGILILMLFVIAFFSMVELSALVAGFGFRFREQKITITGMLRSGIAAFFKAFRGKGILSFLGFMLVVPLAQFTLSSGMFSMPILPMLRTVFGSSGSIIFIIVFIIIELLVVWLLSERGYTLHYLVLTKSPFSECTLKSKRALKGRRVGTALTIILWSVLLLVALTTVIFAVSFLIIYGIKGFSGPQAALVSALRVLSYAGEILFAISTVITAPFIMGSLTSKFLSDDIQEKEITLPQVHEKKHPKSLKIATITTLLAVSIFLNFSYLREIYRGNVSLGMGIFSTTQVTAHRGFSHVAPENTIYAFQEAIAANADYIELDVQQTRDGQLVVFHDTMLDRTTDGKGKLRDFTYEELQTLSCGSWFKKGDFSDAKIMLLSEVLDLVGDDAMLNIEIKKGGNTAETARKTAELLIEYDMTDSCYITSFNYSALKEAKKTDPDIKTALIANIATPSLYTQLRDIDALSLNYIFVNQNIVNSVHKNGKRVFVWTVNTREDIDRMISLGADNIITDRPDIAEKAVYSYGKGDFVLSLLELIFGT